MMGTDFQKGVEKLCKIAMPVLIILMIGLAIYSASLPGAFAGLKWYFKPVAEGLDVMAVIQAAVVQVFFSIGIGMSCAYVYGSYVTKDANMIGHSVGAAAMDTIVAILSGLVITPALFAFGIEPTAGPGLVFISLPQLFTAMGNVPGRIFGFLFLFAVFLACITSMAAVLESLVTNMSDRFGWSRKTGRNVMIGITFGISIIVTLNQGSGPLAGGWFFGYDLFSLLDMLASGFGLTLGAIFMVVYIIVGKRFDWFREEVNQGAGKLRIGKWMKWYYYIVLPIILAFVFYCILHMYFG